jgi:guanylate kinase
MYSDAPKGKAIISAPSGAGKTTIVHYLLNHFSQLAFSVSATNRACRPNERDGIDYYFISTELFKQKAENQEFIEWEEVYEGALYGTLHTEIERIWSLGKTVIFDVDVVGGLDLKAFFGSNGLSIFIQPPSIDALRQRLSRRETETQASLEKRVGKASREMEFASKFDCVIVNDDLERACNIAVIEVSKFLGES